jgi:hypothetical protein
MSDWALVTLCGAAGSLLVSLLESLPALDGFGKSTDPFNPRPLIAWCGRTAITALAGLAAAWLVWALYTTVIKVGTVNLALAGESLIVGLGGVSEVRRMGEAFGRLKAERLAKQTLVR